MLKILIVDDEPAIRSLTSQIAERCGCLVQTACDASDALDQLEKFPFDVLLTDNYMPGMSGLELVQRVKEKFGSSIKIILMSADEGLPPSLCRLPKPFGRREFLRALDSVLSP
jgi:CheY-like chemotaxis protein